MVTGFTKSEEGVKQYSKLGLQYPEELFDRLYEQWLKDTSAEDLSKYTHHKEKEVTKITRLKTGDDEGHEYLSYSFIHYRLDEALNVVHMWRPNIGKYPIPTPRYTTSIGSFGKQQRQIAEIISRETGYSIPFSKKNIEKIKDIGLEYQGKISYSVQVPNGVRIAVASYEDLRNGNFHELVHFGRIPNETQRQRWLDERGIEKDREWQVQALRIKTEGGIPQKSVTAEQVRDMIKEEQQCKEEGHKWVPAYYCSVCGLQSSEALEEMTKKIKKSKGGSK